MIVAILAVLKTGAAYVALDKALTDTQLSQIVEEAEPSVFFDSPKSERTKSFLKQILTH